MGYSRVQKGYKCYWPTLRRYFVSTDVTFFQTTLFSLSSPVPSQGENDDLLVYTIASPAPLTPTPALVLVKPPISQVYSRCENPPVSSPTLIASHQIQSRMMIFQLLSVKVNDSVLTQSLRLFPITICRLPLIPLLPLDSISLPNIVREALSHPGWRSAMVDEMQTLNDNGTWDLVPLPTRKKAIGCR